MTNYNLMHNEIIRSIGQAYVETETLTISFNPITKMLITSDGYGKVLPTLNIKDFEYASRSLDFNITNTHYMTNDAGLIKWVSVDVALIEPATLAQ